MSFPFKWVREPKWLSDRGQVIVLEMEPKHIVPAVSVQSEWNGCKGIIRGVKDAGFLIEDHIREEVQGGRPVDVGRPIVGADEMRKQVWSIDHHKAEFTKRHPDQKIVGWVGNGNLLSNPHFVAFAENSAYHLGSEAAQFHTRTYSSLVVRKSGDKRVAIDTLRYSSSSQGVRIHSSAGADITQELEYATFGQQIVRDGCPLEKKDIKRMAVAQQFYDLRHLFLFGRIPAGEKRWLDAGLAAFWNDSVLNTSAVEAAIDGQPVTVDVQQFNLSTVRAAMDAKGYNEVARPVKPGQFAIEQGELQVILLEGLYPHNMLGIRNDGFVISVVLRGLSNRLGVTIRGAAEIMCQLGAKDALLMDNGGDVMLSFCDDLILGSAEGERNRLRSVLLFRAVTDVRELRPGDYRLVVYPKVSA